MARTHKAAGAAMRNAAGDPVRAQHKTHDSFQNFAARVGIGTENQTSFQSYGFNPTTRNRMMLEWMYRGSWIVGAAVDTVAEDMTRAGIQINSELDPGFTEELHEAFDDMDVWERVNDTIKWARLYGGCVGVLLIDGQNPATPFKPETVGKGQFKGVMALDRWMVQPSFNDLVTEYGRDLGTPRFYQVVADAPALPRMTVHYSRTFRLDGVDLPYYQKISENLWGMSVIERMFDRITAFDSATSGVAQLVYRAHLRTMKIENLRELIAAGGGALEALLQQMRLIRQFQSNESITLLDSKDDFEAHQYTFAGLDDVLAQFGQQISGATGIPLTRLFGQAPKGLNATGESDIRNYYDAIRTMQKRRLRRPIRTLCEIISRSALGTDLPEGFGFEFTPLWQLSDIEKGDLAAKITSLTNEAYGAGIVERSTVLQELKQASHLTGIWTNITDEQITDAESDPPIGEMLQQPGAIDPETGEPLLPGDDTEGALPPEKTGAPPLTGDAMAPHRDAGGRFTYSHGGEDYTVKSPEGRSKKQLIAHHHQQARSHAHEASKQEKTSAELGKTDRGYQYAHEQRIQELQSTKDRLPPPDRSIRPIVEVQGLPIVIETRKGQRRYGSGWSVVMPVDYGYIRGTSSAEGDLEQMDAFIGPNVSSRTAYVIFQKDLKTGRFDEHKVMLGYTDQKAAEMDYICAFSDGRGKDRIMKIETLSIADLRKWLAARYNPTI